MSLAVLSSLLVACGGREPESSPESAATAPGATVSSPPADRDPPVSIDHVTMGNAAFRAGRLFEPADDHALGHFVAALARDPGNAAAREALADLFPLALARSEAAIAAGDRSEAERILVALESVFDASPALVALRERLAKVPAPRPESPTTGELAVVSAPEVGAPNATSAMAGPSAPLAVEPPTPVVEATTTPSSLVPPTTVAIDSGEAGAPARHEVSVVEPPAADAQPRAPKTTAAASSTPARLLERVSPDYPATARQRRIEGWVELEYVVGPDGRVVDVRVVQSYPTRIFDAAAERALKRWRFEPGRRDGEPTTTVGRTRIDFNLG